MTGETNPGLLFLLSGKCTLHVAKGSLAVGLAGWQEKCSLQDTAVITQINPLGTVQSFLKKVWRVHSSWVFFLPWLGEQTKTRGHSCIEDIAVGEQEAQGDLVWFLASFWVCKAFSA